MGREIRKVPKGWEHPRYDEKGRWPGEYIPMFDRDFESAAAAWKADFAAREAGTHEGQAFMPEAGAPCEFWDYDSPPHPDTCRPKFESEPSCFQIYETVTEGTPVSPVFETEEEMIAWLIQQGHSEHAAREFVRGGWAPSMVVSYDSCGESKVRAGIDALDEE